VLHPGDPIQETTVQTSQTPDLSVPDQQWLGLLADMVNTDSAPGDHAGISEIYRLITPALKELGCTVDTIATKGPDVLRARRKGAHPAAASVVMIGHVDTVFPAGTAAARPFTVAGDRAFGPGVADMKGGVVVMLAALSQLSADQLARLNLTVLFNGDEESGSRDSRPVIEAEAAGKDVALVFESARRNGAIVTTRRGVQRFQLDVTGRASHSGSAPGAGANALETLAHKIIAVQELGAHVHGASVNAVLAGGGSRPNIIPDTAHVHIDCRFDDAAAEGTVHEKLRELTGPGPVDGTSTRLTAFGGRPPFGEPAAELANAYLRAGRELGLEITTTFAGGGSDANLTAAKGVPTLDGLGPIGGGAHTDEEYIEVQSIAERASVCARLLTDLSTGR
jgi:glutamate carboxypeptidase